jgi:hypothetical protein
MAQPAQVDASSFQFPVGHLGHLSDKQQTALDRFRTLAVEQGYLIKAGVSGRKTDSHDDATLL